MDDFTESPSWETRPAIGAMHTSARSNWQVSTSTRGNAHIGPVQLAGQHIDKRYHQYGRA